MHFEILEKVLKNKTNGTICNALQNSLVCAEKKTEK